MLAQARIREIDEFGFILIGVIVFFCGLAYFISTQPTEIRKNVTEINIPYLRLDTTNRTITILDVEEKIFRSEFFKKDFVYPLRFSRDEIERIEKIKVEFKSEKGISEIFFVKDKNEIKIYNEIDKNLLNGEIIAKITEKENKIYYLILLIFLTIILSYTFYRKFPEKVFEIEIFAISFIFILLALIIYFGTKKLEDKIHLKIDVIYSAVLSKSFDFYSFPQKYNVTLSFRVKRGIHTADLKISLKNGKENVLFFGKPFGSFNKTYEVYLENKNLLVFEIIGGGMYELEDIKLIFGPARS